MGIENWAEQGTAQDCAIMVLLRVIVMHCRHYFTKLVHITKQTLFLSSTVGTFEFSNNIRSIFVFEKLDDEI
jgi:hypothetical protein